METPEIQKVLKSVLKKIVPSKIEKQQLMKFVDEVMGIANEVSREFAAIPMLAGSVTRDTWLPGKKEIDVFVLFPKTLERKRLEEHGLLLGKKIAEKLNAEYSIEFAEHPYVRIKKGEYTADIVPCYKIDEGEKIKSAVDRTPFHVRYLEKKFHPMLADQARLLKQFMRANDIYGADTKIQGFSGYLCELLILEYGSFIKVLENAIKWNPGFVIDIEGFYNKDEYTKLRKKFKGQALIVIDPVDKNRNVAAAVSTENFFRFKKLAKEFLDNPREDLFFEREEGPISEAELVLKLLKRRTELILIVFEPPKVVPDVLWPQLRAMARRMESILAEYSFVVMNKGTYTNEKDLAIVALEMQVSKLPKIEKKIGPPVFAIKNAKDFVNKYKNDAVAGPWVEDDRWVVEVKRKFTNAKEKIEDSLSKPVDVLKAKGIPNHLAEKIAEKFEVINETEKIVRLIERDKGFGIFLKKFFDKEDLSF